MRKQRVLARRQATPEDSLASLTVGGENTTLLSQMKEYVREAVARQLPCLSHLPPTETPMHCLTPTIRQVIQDQVSGALPPSPQPTPVVAPLTYAAAAAKPPRQTPVLPAQPVRCPTVSFTGVQLYYGNPWRMPDNKPICYACGIPGHVARLCRRRATPEVHPPPEVHARDPQTSSDFQPFALRRSHSPRRRSLSPMLRRPTATETEN